MGSTSLAVKKTTKSRQYNEDQKALALEAYARNGNDLYRTSKETGIPAGTLHRWIKLEQGADAARDGALDERLEQLARQMVAAMPEKVEGANLQELARSLSIVLTTMNLTRPEKEKRTDVREKLTRLLDQYAAQRAESGTREPVDGG